MSDDNTQYIPSIEDVNNEELIKLANLLKTDSYKTTLTNVAAWQEKNIPYSQERSFINLILYPFIAILFLSILNFFSEWYLILYYVSLGGIFSLIFYLILSFFKFKTEFPEFQLGFILKNSLSVNQILKYRLAVCRDYAKLTMALFLNLFPELNFKKYFISIPSHVVAAIEVDENLYVIDKGLPISPVMNWKGLWREKKGKKTLKAELIEVTFKDNLISTNKIKSERISQNTIPNIDTNKITKELMQSLSITPIQNQIQKEFIIRFRLLALQYDVNAITHYSFLEKLKMKIENEFYHAIHRISNIEIIQDGKDILLKVYI